MTGEEAFKGANDSYPESRVCSLCKALKVVLRVVGGFPHRMCGNCDAPHHVDGRKATWRQVRS